MLSQAEADALINMPKQFDEGIMKGTRMIELPVPGDTATFDLLSLDERERFQLDIERGRRAKDKWKIQLRYRGTEILTRLDIGGAAHSNPAKAPTRRLAQFEGMRIPCPHLQRYVEGFGDSWAVPLPPQFTNPDDVPLTWSQFLDYCKVTLPPGAQVSF